jgi:hypothetical protein
MKIQSLIQTFTTLLVLFLSPSFQAQTCLELPEINGTPQTSSVPIDWTIWNGTPDVITGNGIYPTGIAATIQDVNQPSSAGGEMVFFIINPVNGVNTESIQTSIDNLIVGESYTVNVEWQQATLDYTYFSSTFSGGHLGAYLDGILIQTFISNGSIDDIWQVASISFTATASSHVLGLRGIISNVSSRGAIVIDNSFCVSPLPVELIDFTLTNENNHVLLTWKTAAELNNLSFHIQRYTKDETWQNIFETEGGGTTSSENNYSYLDQNAPSKLIYYRLKQIDFNGKERFSEIKTIDRSEILVNIEISLYPNPTSDQLIIIGKNIKEFSILNNIGQQLNIDSKVILKSKNRIEINVQSLENGIYFIRTNKSIKRFIKN